MKKIETPIMTTPAVVGPGSQPGNPDGEEMTFMQMPSNMSTFEAPIVPEPEEIDGQETAIAMSHGLLDMLRQYRVGDKARVLVLDGLDDINRSFFNQLLGEGEVSMQCNGNLNAMIQESLLAGVWRAQYVEQYVDEQQRVIRDTIEVADIPGLVSELTFADAADNIDMDSLSIPESVYNARPLLTEVSDKLAEYHPGAKPHIINLSLLPHTEEDLLFLSDTLGIGPIIILSRGYGNCRISSTGTRNVWWVQYFNSQETLILNTLEINTVPKVACASDEDIADSAQRLDEILSIYRVRCKDTTRNRHGQQ